MKIDTSRRSEAHELMDDFNMEGEILRDALDKIANINRLLGGNQVTLAGVKTLIADQAPGKKIRILDVGCGNGDMLRSLANYAKAKKLSFDLTGLDANPFTISHATELSLAYPNINYRCADIFDDIKEQQPYDITLCTLTLHHFKNEEIISLLRGFAANSRLGFVINDLHRSRLAYYLFSALCYVFGLNKMSRDDGLVSILRGFKKEDLYLFSKTLQFTSYSIKWKWAFRYQWIVKTHG